jgi:O-antigen/teichoic acid export membrane protein
VVSRAHLIRGVFTLGIAQLLSWVGAIAVAVLLPRYLGDVNLGKFAFATAYTSLFGLIADLGAATYVAKEVARDHERAASLAPAALVMRVPLALVGGLAAIGSAHLIGYDRTTLQSIYVLSLGIVISAMSTVTIGAVQGFHHMKAIGVSQVLTKLGFAGLVAVWLFNGGGPVQVAAAWVLSQSFGLMVGLVVLRRKVRLVPRMEWKVWRVILVGGLPFFIWQASLLIYGQIDAVLLSFLSTDAVIGWYSAAYRVIQIPVFIPSIVVTVVFPALSAAGKDMTVFSGIARRATHVVIMMSVPIAFGIMLLPDKLIGVLGYPDTFKHSIAPLVLLAPHIPLLCADMMLGTVLNTRDRQRQWALTGVAAAVLNPTLNFIAIPYAQSVYGNGAIGAAAITTVTEVFMLVVGLWLLPKGVFNRTSVLGAGRCLAAGLIMAVAVFVTRDLPIAVPVLLGALVYGVSCLALGAVSRDDVKLVWGQLAQRRIATEAAG